LQLSATVALMSVESTAPAANWQSLLDLEEAKRPLAVAFDVAKRLADPQVVERAVASARANTTEPQSIHWHPPSIAQGDAGIALMFGCFDACFPDQGWDQLAHQSVERAVSGAENFNALSGGLFEGLSGAAFTVAYLSRSGRRYRKLLDHLHECVIQRARAECVAFDQTLSSGPVPFSAWDVISGLSGAAVYLLTRGDEITLTEILKRLVALCEDADGLPRWFTPPEVSGPWMHRTYPEGHLNCGLAHGIPGPLAILSLSLREGIAVPGIESAIDRIAEWVSHHSVKDAWGINWPSAVPVIRREGGISAAGLDGLPATHAGWCYGSPGVARSLWWAGLARGNAAYCDLAIEAMRAVMRRTSEARGLRSPALCHGFAGLLCFTLRFAQDVPDPDIAAFGKTLVQTVVDLHEPDTLLGYRTTGPGGGRIEQAGLLDGAPGVAMALLAASTPQAPVWDRLFLLS
jgi:hypothetical protein